MSLRGVCERRWSRETHRSVHGQHSADGRGAACRQETGSMATIMAGGSDKKKEKKNT